VNNDGFDDLLIGAETADGGGGSSGEVYLILGRSTANWDSLTDASGNFNLNNMSDDNLTVRFIGRNATDTAYIVRNAGDANNDGYADLLIGAPYADVTGGAWSNSGEAYLFFGRSTANWASLTDASGNFNMDNI
jgi:hypothetical protein